MSRFFHPTQPRRRARLWLIGLLLILGCLGRPGGFAQAVQTPNSPPAPTKTIQSASEVGYPPFCVVTENGRADGFSVELLRATLQTMNRDVKFQVGTWTQVKQALAEGRVEVLPLVGRTPEREKLYDFSFPYIRLHGTILVRDNETAIHSLEDLQGRQIAVMAGDNAEEFLRRSDLQATIVTTETFEEALVQLSQGQHDAVIIQKLLALQLMNQLELVNLRTIGPPLTEFVQNFCFAVQKGNQELLQLLNEGLSLLFVDGTFNRLQHKWFGPIEALEYRRSRIIVGGDNDYPPYEFIDEFGLPAGYNVDLTRAIAQQLGLAVEIRLGPWAEIRQGLEKGRIDIVQGMFYSEKRDKDFAFSPGHSVVNHVVVARAGTTMPRNLADLSGRSLVVMDGDIMHDLVLERGLTENLLLADSQKEALHLLAEGKAQLALVAKLPALYWIKQQDWGNLQVADWFFLAPEYCYAAPQRNEGLARLFSEGLANVKGTGQYRSIYAKWLGVYEKTAIGWRDVLKFSLVTTVPIFLLLAGTVVWSRTLRRQVERRTAELQAEINERQQRELEIRSKNTELDRKNAELERFTYTVSHDLKSPLVTLKSFLGFIEADLNSGNREKLEKDLYFMHNAIDKMSVLLVDLLRLSQVGHSKVPPEPVTFHELVETAIALVSGTIDETGAEIKTAEDSVVLTGDRSRLTEIWQNLIDNALKYRQTEVSPKIEIGFTNTPDGPTFFVRDNGIGIDVRYKGKIFGLFNQLDPKIEGSGIGLALVARIVEIYDGTIWVESKGIGHGACFCFTLPGAFPSQPGQ